MNRHQVGVAAEAFAAGFFAHCGCSVFVQYGANQPGFDLMVDHEGKSLRVSVKGSRDGGWILTTKRSGESYAEGLTRWIKANSGYVFCYVRFWCVDPGEMPRMYLASADEVYEHQKTAWYGRDVMLSLWESHAPKSGPNKGSEILIPRAWKSTPLRVRHAAYIR